MVKLKIFFVMGMIISALIVCAFAPGICIERFILPDGCCMDCTPSTSAYCNQCLAGDSERCSCR